jgi:hypothetical protein
MRGFCVVCALVGTLLVPATSFAKETPEKIAECHRATLKVYPDPKSPEHKAAMARCFAGQPI